MEVEFTISREVCDHEIEISVTAFVTYTKPWAGSVYSCPSDADYYGGYEVNDIKAEKGFELDFDEEQLCDDLAIEAFDLLTDLRAPHY